MPSDRTRSLVDRLIRLAIERARIRERLGPSGLEDWLDLDPPEAKRLCDRLAAIEIELASVRRLFHP